MHRIILKHFYVLFSLLFSLSSFASLDEPRENVGGFIAGTLVQTMSGPDTIQNIRVNDSLKSFSQETGLVVESKVLDTYMFQVEKLAKLRISGETFYLNPDHRFYIPDSSEWISAEDLEVGSVLLNKNGDFLVLEEKEIIYGREWVYDFTVEDTENYFVGKKQVLVHNFAFVVPVATWVVGEGLVWATAATIAVTIGVTMAANSVSRSSSNQQGRYDLNFGRFDASELNIGRYGQDGTKHSDSDSRNPAQDKKLSEAEGKRIDAESIKAEIVGPRGGSRYDIYKDRNGDLYVKPKGGKGPGEPTGRNIKDYN